MRICSLTTVEYEIYGIAKVKRQIKRQPKEILEGPGKRLAVDFYDYEPRLDKYLSSLLITDR